MTVFAEDEAAVQRSQNPAYGWRQTEGREQVRTGFSRESVRIFGAMSEDELRIRIVDRANSETFQEFLEEIRRDHPRFCMILDNASYHKSKAVREYVESRGGDVELEFLPSYTPQLNPVETVWRDLKRRLACRFFRSLDELKAAITVILEREMATGSRVTSSSKDVTKIPQICSQCAALHFSVFVFVLKNFRARKMPEWGAAPSGIFRQMSGLL